MQYICKKNDKTKHNVCFFFYERVILIQLLIFKIAITFESRRFLANDCTIIKYVNFNSV